MKILTWCMISLFFLIGTAEHSFAVETSRKQILKKIDTINKELDRLALLLDETDEKIRNIEQKISKIKNEQKEILLKIGKQRQLIRNDFLALFYSTILENSLDEQNVISGPLLWQARLTKQAVIKKRLELKKKYEEEREKLCMLEGVIAREKKELEDAKKVYVKRIERLKRLRREKISLLASINKSYSSIPKVDNFSDAYKIASHNIWKLKGKLQLPTKGVIFKPPFQKKGSVLARFLYNKGVFISAPSGADVVAVSDGRVAFAGWFREFGRVVIIDHGDHFFSVMAYLGTVLKKRGDRVLKGEVVGRVGKAELTGKSGIYFEWRHNGKPLPIKEWFVTSKADVRRS